MHLVLNCDDMGLHLCFFFRFSLRSQIDDFSFFFILNSSWNVPFCNFSFLVFSFVDYFSKISCRTLWGIVKILSMHCYADTAPFSTVFDANVSPTIFLYYYLSVSSLPDVKICSWLRVCWSVDSLICVFL